MGKLSAFVAIFLLFSTLAMGQQVPRGMKYQAVARDRAGEVLANKKVSLRISLFSGAKPSNVFYSEVHELITNQFGLFDLVIGEGKTEKGEFGAVPWSQEDIWMQVAMKEAQSGAFITISSSKLLAVPYAFHAATASELVPKLHANSNGVLANSLAPTIAGTSTSGTNSSQGNSWNVGGNLGTTPPSHYLGTADNVFFVIKTNALERMRVAADGNISINRTLSVGANLNADSNVYLNKALPWAGAPYGGSTLNYGPFTVGTATRRSPTFLSGRLTIDASQPTLLGGTLTVDQATLLNSTLTVNGITDLNSNLNVNNASPTVLTGTLRVDKDARFKKQVFIDTTLNSDTLLASPNGALAVRGGVGIDRNLNVGGDVRFGGHATFGGAVAINDLTQSTNTTSGALTVGGGVGIGKRLNVGEGAQLNSTLDVTGATSLANTLGVAGITSLNNTATSTNSTTGALTVAGGAGIAENLNVGGTLTTAGAAIVNNTLTVNANTGSNGYVAHFNNTTPGVTDANGIEIKINTSQSNNSNHFVTFKDGNNNVVGRIQGETLGELHDDLDYQLELTSKSYDVISGAIDVGLATVGLIQAVQWNVGAAASANACAGLGIVACPPIASLIAVSIANVVEASIEEALVVSETVIAATNLGLWVDNKEGSIGVTYQSGAGDYAEFLMKQLPDEKLMPGDIVGVKGGRISKTIEGAERVMVVSYKPIVLGNTPSAEAEKYYEKVAFMGQVPVKVTGKVNLGDYIIPNGLNNGIGVAVSPSDIRPKDVKNIVGIAWSTSESAVGLKNINVAIGLNVNDNQRLIEKQQNEIEELKNQIAQTNTQLEKLIPGFKAPGHNATSKIATVTPVARNGFSSRNVARVAMASNDEAVPETLSYPVMGENEVRYTEITRTDFLHAFEIAEENMKNSGHKEKFEKFWSRFHSDPTYREESINKLMKQYKTVLDNQKATDAKLNHGRSNLEK